MRKVIITCIENILPLFETNIKHGLKLKNELFFTNKYSETLTNFHQQIQQVKKLKNTKFIYNYESAVDYLHRNNKNKPNTEAATLLIGEPCPSLFRELVNQKIITVEEICRLFPEKVPLSYRSKQNKQIKTKIQKRIGISLDMEPHIHNIYYTGHFLKMWDQGIQVILDHHAEANIIQYENQHQNSQYYRLSKEDFVKGVNKCYQIVHGSSLPNVIDLNKDNLHIEWIIKRILKDREDLNQSAIVIDEDLVNDSDKLIRAFQNVQIERVDESSSLWG